MEINTDMDMGDVHSDVDVDIRAPVQDALDAIDAKRAPPVLCTTKYNPSSFMNVTPSSILKERKEHSYFDLFNNSPNSFSQLFTQPSINPLDFYPNPEVTKPPVSVTMRAIQQDRKAFQERYDRGDICRDAYDFYMEQCDDELYNLDPTIFHGRHNGEKRRRLE